MKRMNSDYGFMVLGDGHVQARRASHHCGAVTGCFIRADVLSVGIAGIRALQSVNQTFSDANW